VNLASNERKLESLLRTFRFGRLGDLIPPADDASCETATRAAAV